MTTEWGFGGFLPKERFELFYAAADLHSFGLFCPEMSFQTLDNDAKLQLGLDFRNIVNVSFGEYSLQ